MNIESIPIFLACDDNYAPFLCTTMYSILLYTKSNVNFYVMDGGISATSKKLIDESLKSFKHKKITYFDISKYGLERFPNLRHYSLNTFSRYFIPDLTPTLKKILYIDVDVIIKDDIAELYNQNLGKYAVGAVLEDFYAGNYSTLKNKIWPAYQGKDRYFNAGVMLLDIQKFIKNNYSKQLVDLTIELFDKLSCPDQDVLNILFDGNFKVLDYRYNFMPDHERMLQEKHPERGIVEPLVIHYTAQKPWKAQSARSADFNEILQRTKFAKIVKKKFMQQTIHCERRKNVKKYKLFGFLPLLKIEEV